MPCLKWIIGWQRRDGRLTPAEGRGQVLTRLHQAARVVGVNGDQRLTICDIISDLGVNDQADGVVNRIFPIIAPGSQNDGDLADETRIDFA